MKNKKFIYIYIYDDDIYIYIYIYDDDVIHHLDKLNTFSALALELLSSMARALGL